MRYLMFVLFMVFSFFTMNAWASGTETASALFCGAKNEILKYNCFRVCYTETRGEEFGQTVSQIVDYDHGMMRKEHLQNDKFCGWIGVLNNSEIYSFRYKEHEDVKLAASNSNIAELSGIYDPRILFLGELPFYTSKVEAFLPCGIRSENVIVEDAVIDGVPTKRIAQKKDGWAWEYYITEPGFRVIKVTFLYSSPSSFCTTISKYDNPNLGPFPSEIKIHRERDGQVMYDRTIHVTSFEVKKSFPSDTFTYKSMNLPLNTAIVDYRINRRIGYWDGEKLVDDPVRMSVQEQREWEAKQNRHPLGNAIRYVMMSAGILLIVFALVSMIRKRLQERKENIR